MKKTQFNSRVDFLYQHEHDANNHPITVIKKKGEIGGMDIPGHLNEEQVIRAISRYYYGYSSARIPLERSELSSNWLAAVYLDNKIRKTEGQDNISPESPLFKARPSVGDVMEDGGIVIHVDDYFPYITVVFEIDNHSRWHIVEERYLGEVSVAVEYRGYVVHKEELNSILKCADELFDFHGDGWGAYVDQELERAQYK